MKNNLKKIVTNKYFLYTIFFLFISFFVFFPFLVSHKSFVWNVDGLKQHVLLLYDYNDYLRNLIHNFHTFSFNLGLGQDIIGQYSYYVIGDPFVYLSLFFPMHKMELAYTLIIYLKFYMVGISFLCYTSYKKKNKFSSLLGAFLYTFSGFCLYAGVRHLSFLNPVILFPFFLIGVDKLIHEDKKSFLIIVAAMGLIINYYFFIIISILSILYAIITLLVDYSLKKDYKIILKKGMDAFQCYIIAILISGVIFFPTLYTYLNSARVGGFRIGLYDFNYYRNLVSGLITNASYGSRYWSIIGMSSISLLFIPLLIKNYKSYKKLFFYFLFMGIMLMIPIFGQFMNGFGYPLNRWVFGFNFVIALIVTNLLSEKVEYTKQEKKWMGVGLILYSVFAFALAKNRKEILLMLWFSYCIYIIVLCCKTKAFKKIKIKPIYFIDLLTICNLICFSWMLYGPKIGKKYVNTFVDQNAALSSIENNQGQNNNLNDAIAYMKNDKTFYRSTIYPLNIQNLATYYNYNSLSSYFSLSLSGEESLSRDLENSSYRPNRFILNFDNRTRITTRLSNKYYILSKKYKDYLPYGYEEKYSNGDTILYQNKYYVSPLVYFDSYIDESTYDQLLAIDREQVLLDTVVLESKTNKVSKFENIQENIDQSKQKMEFEVDSNSKLKIKDHQIEVNSTKDKLILNLKNVKNSEIYMLFDNIHLINSSTQDNKLYINLANTLVPKDIYNIYGFKIQVQKENIRKDESTRNYFTDPYYFKNEDFLINLGYEKNWQGKVEITFSKTGTYSFDDFGFYAVSMNSYKESIKKIKNANIENYSDDSIAANIQIEKTGIMCLSTAYSKGWNVYIDGKRVDTFKVNKSMLGFYISKGNHKIDLIYKTPYLKVGFCSTILGIGLLIFIIKKG